tara:strand:- start:389 stop:526 length:138 start_codon:yes stop_codon:yes gene_type:complete
MKEDPLGWFQKRWRFANGRRIPKVDKIQTSRWGFWSLTHRGLKMP